MTNKHTEASLRRRYEVLRERARQIRTDADAWNALHPEEEPITINLDFTDEVRKAMEADAS
ncbi:MAG: hypothetical protein IIC01_12690 [Planctomycetes bacterium]|nr:hypothetical protein [Planctomycetota bacterium]